MADLKEAGQLFRSNLFKMQTDEMLKLVRLDYDQQSQLDGLLFTLKAALEAIPTTPQASVDFTHRKHATVPLLLGRAEATAIPFEFKPPAQSTTGTVGARGGAETAWCAYPHPSLFQSRSWAAT
jgi:hypothetical protein